MDAGHRRAAESEGGRCQPTAHARTVHDRRKQCTAGVVQCSSDRRCTQRPFVCSLLCCLCVAVRISRAIRQSLGECLLHTPTELCSPLELKELGCFCCLWCSATRIWWQFRCTSNRVTCVVRASRSLALATFSRSKSSPLIMYDAQRPTPAAFPLIAVKRADSCVCSAGVSTTSRTPTAITCRAIVALKAAEESCDEVSAALALPCKH
jgi:hypothetical protein